MAPKCALSKAGPKTDELLSESVRGIFHLNLELGSLWGLFSSLGVSLHGF